MRIAVSGSSGLVGSAVVADLAAAGHEVLKLVRRDPAASDEIRWDPARGELNPAALADVDAVIHLAGENLEGKWTDDKRRLIRDSRVKGAKLLVEALLANDPSRGRVLIAASAIGFYGSRGAEPLTEDSPAGSGFLAEVCQQLEQVSQRAAAAGVRVVNLRFGYIQTPDGGMLGTQLPLARRGLAARIGLGRRLVSWVSIDDVCGAIQHVLGNAALSGPVNVVAPNPVSNAEYTRLLARTVGRPAWLALPPLLPRLALGEFATEVLLQSSQVRPTRLLDSGYVFRHAHLHTAFRDLVARSDRAPVTRQP